MKIAIIGAGISGLSSALVLAKQNHEVHIFQKEASIGGLIATFDFNGIRAEHFYHFLCRDDHGVFELCRELGIDESIVFRKASTGFYCNGHLYPFSTASDLLQFSPLTLKDRIRFGLFALASKWRKDWDSLDKIPAKAWLLENLGKHCYDIIWKPLLEMKFGAFHDHISAAWVWHRVHRVARSNGKLGYLQGGTGKLMDVLTDELQSMNIKIHTASPVHHILTSENKITGLVHGNENTFVCDKIISTVPMKILSQLLPEGYTEYQKILESVHYIGVVCVLFKLARPVSNHFWLNVHDPDIPFNGVIEYTNLNPLSPNTEHLVYVPYYIDTSLAPYTEQNEKVIEDSWTALKRIQPALTDSDLLDVHVARTPFAQAVCPVEFCSSMPNQNSPIQGLHLLDSIFLYPEDRTQSGHIKRAKMLVESEEFLQNL